jgi:hypothetical protein
MLPYCFNVCVNIYICFKSFDRWAELAIPQTGPNAIVFATIRAQILVIAVRIQNDLNLTSND